MWNDQTEWLQPDRIVKYRLQESGTDLTYTQVIELWQSRPDFCRWFTRRLAKVPFEDFRWETPALTIQNQSQPFEFVVISSPGLADIPEPEPFAEYFETTTRSVVSFPNLGKNAILIVPCPVMEPIAYRHLGSFVRDAPISQCESLWQRVGECIAGRLSSDPVWLNTAGAGVSWLHVRLDDRPKYYHYQPYTELRE